MQVAEGLDWSRIYWVAGPTPKGAMHNSVTNPPVSGWQHAFVMPGEKRSTIFCPYSFRAFSVSNAEVEMQSRKDSSHSFRLKFVAALMKRNWAQFQGWGWQRDYDTCALVLRKLDLPIPAQIMTGGEKDIRKSGGKSAGPILLKPVNPSSKRGIFLLWFLTNKKNSRSVREAMAELSMARSSVLSYLSALRKDHGIGYELAGDMATIILPKDCKDPFRGPGKIEDDDSWLN